MTITDFIANTKNFARPNKFRVQITWPAVVGTPNIRDEFVVTSAGMPASMVGTVLVPYMGRQIPIPGDRTFEDWTINVLNDTSHSHRNAFERWLNLINSHEGNVQGVDSYKDLTAVIDVTQLSQAGLPLKNIKLLNAWPNNLSQIDLAYDMNDMPAQFSVTFAYSHWASPSTPTS